MCGRPTNDFHNSRNSFLDSRFRVVLALIFFATLRLIFAFPDPLRLQEMKSKRKPHMKPLPAKPAPDWKLEESKTGKVRKTHPRCPELWSTAVGAIHSRTCPYLVENGPLLCWDPSASTTEMRRGTDNVSTNLCRYCGTSKSGTRLVVTKVHGRQITSRRP